MNFETKMVEIVGVEISVMVRQRNDQGPTQSQPVETGSLNAVVQGRFSSSSYTSLPPRLIAAKTEPSGPSPAN